MTIGLRFMLTLSTQKLDVKQSLKQRYNPSTIQFIITKLIGPAD